MSRLLPVLLILALLCLNGIAAHSFSGSQSYEAQHRGSQEEETWTDSDYDDAEIALQAALLATQGDFNKQLPVLQGLADIYHERQKYNEEISTLLALIKVMYSIDDYPIIPLAAQQLRLSTVYYLLDDYQSAASAGRMAVDLLKKDRGQEPTNLALACNNLGWVELKLGNFDAALKLFEESLSVLSKSVGKKSLLYGLISENLGALYTQKGDHRSAFIWYQASLKTLAEYLPKDDAVTVEIVRRCNRARLLSKTTNKQRTGSLKTKNKLAGERESQK